MCEKIREINDVNTRTSRPFIQIKSIKGLELKWLFDTGAGLTCISSKAFRKIDKEYRPSKINKIGSRAQQASQVEAH
jgi:hypothetical protein